ncbi:SIMPL domain-containing protein [Frigidibacter mobilis]|uniref:Outer membrane protein, 28Kda n=1 Tax=Frigidibacter mobilis TaxID=1335048 RepID=A0A165SQB6_9RHOB|nr:SIMPL domain-containing protein [Frigidibacter mobilis]AMY70093.1 outer membrane protein, 28Kda [Frigidibacter mobilis]
MRIFNVVAMVAALGMGAGVPALALADEGHITVTGNGNAEAAPDMASVSLGVVTEAATAAEAMAANSAALTEVLATLTGAGIERRDIQSSGLSLSPAYEDNYQGGPEGPKVRGFIAQNNVTVRVRALDSLGGVLDAAVGQGANNLYGLTFGLQDPGPKMDDARRDAVADARRKAELYALAAGVKLGEVISISEQVDYGGPIPQQMRAASFAKDSGVPVAEGELSLSASVTVVYDLAD